MRRRSTHLIQYPNTSHVKLSIITRVVVAVLVVVVSFGAALAYNVVTQRDLVDRVSRIHDGYVPVVRRLDDARGDVQTLSRILAESDPVVLRQSLRASMRLAPFPSRVDAELAALQSLISERLASDPDDREAAFLRNVAASLIDLRADNDACADMTAELLRSLDRSEPDDPALQGRLQDRLGDLDRRLGDLVGVVETRIDGALAEVRRAEDVLLVRVVAGALGALGVALLMLGLVRRSLQPIRRLTAAAEQLKRGDYALEAVEAGQDELGALAAEFTSMAEAIRDRDHRLRQQRNELETAYRDLVEAQQARVQAERLAAVGEMSTRVTHELRNPLSSLGLNVEMLGEELAALGSADGELVEIVRSIDREVQRLIQLTDDYLGMARRPGRDELVELHALVEDVADQLAGEFAARGVALELRLHPTMVRGEPQRLRQLVINLAQNALAACAGTDESTVRLTVRPADARAELLVDDTGSGVDGDLGETIFEPFVTGRADGTGLGLTICRDIAASHGGSIVVERSGTLGGARFIVSLPRHRDEAVISDDEDRA